MEATSCRLLPLLRPLISSSSSRTFRAYRLLSSSSNYHSCRSRPPFLGDQKERCTGSIVYQHTLKTQRPSTIRWQKDLENHASFIGRVVSPVKLFPNLGSMLGAYAQLKVESPSGSNKFFKLVLNMWGDMAELSIQHLKLNDYIYVSGILRSYTKACDNGNIILRPKVIVREINYVTNNDKNKNNIEDPEESALEKRRKRLHLWQIFFSNPHEWRDLRKSKMNPKQPDFKHRGTGESLWLSVYDPPWVMRQLQLQDSRMGDMGLGERLSHRSSLSSLSFDDS